MWLISNTRSFGIYHLISRTNTPKSVDRSGLKPNTCQTSITVDSVLTDIPPSLCPCIYHPTPPHDCPCITDPPPASLCPCIYYPTLWLPLYLPTHHLHHAAPVFNTPPHPMTAAVFTSTFLPLNNQSNEEQLENHSWKACTVKVGSYWLFQMFVRPKSLISDHSSQPQSVPITFG